MFVLAYADQRYEFASLEAALEAAKNLAVSWYIYDPQGQIAFDWMDRVGP